MVLEYVDPAFFFNWLASSEDEPHYSSRNSLNVKHIIAVSNNLSHYDRLYWTSSVLVVENVLVVVLDFLLTFLINEISHIFWFRLTNY